MFRFIKTFSSPVAVIAVSSSEGDFLPLAFLLIWRVMLCCGAFLLMRLLWTILLTVKLVGKVSLGENSDIE